MRCDSAIVVSSGLPMVLVSRPLPPSRPVPLELGRALGMDEHEDAELLGLGPERVKLRVAQLEAVDAAPETGPAQAACLDPVLELFDGEIRMLQGDRRKCDEPVGLRAADLRERLVLDPDELLRDVPVGRVPVRVDAEGLDIDALLVHRAEALLRVRHEERLRLERPPHERHRRGHRAVRVHVHGLHTPAAHHHLAPPPLRGAAPAARDEHWLGHG